MEYINVAQFYQSVLCFSLPLLLIQRLLLCCCGLSAQYEDYRRMFYEQQFQFTKDYDHATEDPALPAQPNLKQNMLEGRQDIRDAQGNQKEIEIQIHRMSGEDDEQRSRVSSFSKQMQPSINDGPIRHSFSKVGETKKIKIDFDLETDRELRNSSVSPSAIRQEVVVNQQLKKGELNETELRQNQSQQKEDEGNQPAEIKVNEFRQQEVKMEQIEESRMSRVTHSDIEVRRETQLDEDMERPETDGRTESEGKEKHVIELGRGTLLEKGEKDKVRLRYCRRVDDAFNDYVPVIMSLMVLGICTKSVYIYSMCCFFGYAFSSLLFNYVHLLDRLEGADQKTFFGRANQLISSLFIIGLFISYWVSTEFY